MKDISSVFPNLKYNDKYDCGDDTYMFVVADTDAVRFEELCRETEKAGFTLIDSNYIDSNLSHTYRKDYLLHIYYVPSEKTIRIIADGMTGEYAALPVKSEPSILPFCLMRTAARCLHRGIRKHTRSCRKWNRRKRRLTWRVSFRKR